LCVIALCAAAAATADAQEWTPQRALRLIVPFPPGGTADLLARLLATPMGNASASRSSSTIAAGRAA